MRRRLRYWFQRDRRESQMREEMEFHLDMRARELIESGVPADEARARAQREFGNLTLQQEDARAVWIARWLEDLWQDLGYTARSLRRRPGFAAVAVLSATLGIGGCALLFALANHALFRSLPVDEPARLMTVTGINTKRGKIGSSLTYPDFQDLRQAASWQAMAAFYPLLPGVIATGGEPQRYWGELVTVDYFDVVRPAFAAGRGFTAGAGESAVVLSHALWRSRFGADPGLIGRTIQLNGRPVSVIGVTAEGFHGTETMFPCDFWAPFPMLDAFADAGLNRTSFNDRTGQWLLGVGRLRPGVSEAQGRAELASLGARLQASYPASNRDRAFHVERAGQVNPAFRKLLRGFFLLLAGVAVLVLLTSCANVANLLLARAASRQKEIAIRMAIGSGRLRLLRQLLTESVVLAALGGAGGLALAQLGVTLLGALRLPFSIPLDLAIRLDTRVVLFCAALSVVTGVLFGLIPALRATRPELTPALKDEPVRLGGSRRFTLRNALVVAQVTVCMVLLLGSALFVRSFDAARRIDAGFANRDLLLLSFDLADARSPAAVLAQLRQLPGVESASLATGVPLQMDGTQNAFTPLGTAEKVNVQADIYTVSPGYFTTLGMRVLDGEDFRDGAAAGDTVIVNDTLARRAFPGEPALGRSIAYQGRTLRIAGIVNTVKSRTIGEEPHSCLYLPLTRAERGLTALLRTRGNPATFAAAAKAALAAVDPTAPVFNVRTMDQHLAQALFLPRLAALLFGLAGAIGLTLAIVGLYGVVSFAVSQQTREFGIRMALGAQRTAVLGLVLRRGLVLASLGALLGLGAALALARAASSLLYGVRATDPLTFLLVPPLLLLAALASCLLPARRAATLDPLRALRTD